MDNFFGVLGINSDGVNTTINIVILALVVVWVALVFWTYADARRRIDDGMLVMCSAAASLLFPFIGTVIYMIVRSPEYLDDVRLRELELQAAELQLEQLGYQVCPNCDCDVKSDFVRCPNCMRRLKDRCSSCAKPMDASWRVCPHCEAEVSAAPPSPSAQRRRRPTLSDETVAFDVPTSSS